MGLELGGRKRWNFGIFGGRDGWTGGGFWDG